jgi:hypothetical protein
MSSVECQVRREAPPEDSFHATNGASQYTDVNVNTVVMW